MIEAKNERFWQCVDREAKVEKVAVGVKQARAAVFSRRGYLLVADAGRIVKWERGQTTVEREVEAASITFDHQGRLLGCERGRVTRREKDGSMTVLAEAREPVPG